MATRRVVYKHNEFIEKCPLCGNNTEFTVRSEQVGEDCCEIWAICKCGYCPTIEHPGSRVEDVWGGVDDDNCKDAIVYSWNEPIEMEKEK